MGLWHGAAWTFVIFGLFHGILIVLETVTENYRTRIFEFAGINEGSVLKNSIGMIATFSLLTFSLTFFRANSLSDSILLISNAFDFSDFKETLVYMLKNNELTFGILMIIMLMLAEYLHAKYDLVRVLASKPLILRWSVYTGFIFFVLFFGVLYKTKFIYFQF
jgi:D-alanyl-lipoteichoic acid acyltransferase DltB (MBOAT superfamily)